ncbi:hypothetical protein HXW73_08380 [Halomonas sp. SH5A2]|nr:hypothetical protein HXW73_08380 [Halomonas sp. SH5A2]
MNSMIALNFLPQDQINLSHSHEKNELKRYRWLALTFLPFDSSISSLMSAIGLECVRRLLSLQEIARKMELEACIDTDNFEKLPLVKTNSQHFFVVDKTMGYQFLARAEEAAQESCSFYRWLLETNATPELHRTLFDFVTQKDSEYLVLQECREQWSMIRSL